jgi:hypothetical protein
VPLNCTAVVPLNYCHFTTVQIQPQLTVGAVLSVPTATPLHVVQKDQFIFISVLYNYNCVSVIGCLQKQLRVRLMYLAHFYTNTVNITSYPQKLCDCGQSDHMKTCT